MSNRKNPPKDVGSSTPFGSSVRAQQSATGNNPPPIFSPLQGGAPSGGQLSQLSDPRNVFSQAIYQQGNHQQPHGPSAHTLFQQSQIQPRLQDDQLSNPTRSGVRTRGTGRAKRGTPRPLSRLAGSSNTNRLLLNKTPAMELTPAVKKNDQKVPVNKLPDKVASILPNSALHTQLLEFEGRVDASLERKKLDVQEALRNPVCPQTMLRIYVFNTFSNQGETASDNQIDEVPSWSLKITGRVVDDSKDPVLSGLAQKPSSAEPKFTLFFKKVTVYLDQNLYPDDHVIQWESVRAPVPLEGFEVKRKGNKEFTALIKLELNYIRAKFKLSLALKEVLGIEIDTRPGIVAAIWNYVKSKKLQSPHDPTIFICDSSLQKVFGEERMKFAMVSQKLSPHLTPPQPIYLEHQVKLSGDCPAGLNCYDVLVDIPFKIVNDMTPLLENIEKNKEIDKLDQNIYQAIKELHQHQQRRAFFLSFSNSPSDFITAHCSVENEQKSEFYKQTWTEDATLRYMNRKSQESDPPKGS